MMKNQKGITLVALVITIIVLLILAGVSIAMLTGDNGLLGRATSAAKTSKIAEAKEAAQLDVNAAMAAYYENNYVTSGATSYDNFKAYLTAHELTSSDTKKYTVSGTTITLVPDNSITGTIGDNGGITWSDTNAE